jgi:hypothetical protein
MKLKEPGIAQNMEKLESIRVNTFILQKIPLKMKGQVGDKKHLLMKD